MIFRLERDTAVACALMAMLALVVWPDRPGVAGGVLAGGLLVGLAFWALHGVVDQLVVRGENGELRPVSRAFPLVKFFTRHVILALAAYGMMVRLHLDPIGMLLGVSALTVAAVAAAIRSWHPGRRQ